MINVDGFLITVVAIQNVMVGLKLDGWDELPAWQSTTGRIGWDCPIGGTSIKFLHPSIIRNSFVVGHITTLHKGQSQLKSL